MNQCVRDMIVDGFNRYAHDFRNFFVFQSLDFCQRKCHLALWGKLCYRLINLLQYFVGYFVGFRPGERKGMEGLQVVETNFLSSVLSPKIGDTGIADQDIEVRFNITDFGNPVTVVPEVNKGITDDLLSNFPDPDKANRKHH